MRRGKVDKSILAIPTFPRKEDESHLAKIRSLPCCNCYSTHVIQAAHVRFGSYAGMSKKPDDERTVPLCMMCHHRQHAQGELRFWGEKLQDALKLCSDLYGSSKDEMEALVYRFWKDRK